MNHLLSNIITFLENNDLNQLEDFQELRILVERIPLNPTKEDLDLYNQEWDNFKKSK